MLFRSTFLSFFGLIYLKEEVWPSGMHPMLFTESSCVCMPSFNLVAPFFLVKYLFGLICLVHKGVWPYRPTRENSPGDTDSKYMGLWVYL